MKKILLIGLLLASVTAKAQYSQTKKDDFTGKTNKTSIVLVAGAIGVGFATIAEKTYVTLAWTMTSYSEQQKAENMTLLFKFDNGNIVKFKAGPESKIGKLSNGSASIGLMAEITPEQLAYFKDNLLSKVRFGVLDDNGPDLPMSSKNYKEFQKAAAYMLN